MNLVLGYLPPPTPRPHANFNSLWLQQNSWKRPTHRSRVWKQNHHGNGQRKPWDGPHSPCHACPTKQTGTYSNPYACVVHLPPRQLPNNDVNHQHERCYLGGMSPSTIQMRSKTQQLGDFQSISKHDVDQIGQPQDFGSVPSPAGNTQDPSKLGELQLDNGSDCDSRVDLCIDVDPAQYDKSCSHSSSASIALPDLELTDNYTSDHASDLEGQHSVHDPGEDYYDDVGHCDTGEFHEDNGVDLDPVDDYHDDYYDNGGDCDYYDNDY
ncbi:hypothetical protein MJO29_002288 [Puccinia striiformis f. sp. tritici]|nr:hypothetical protein MJO29_002288 [Puccinia striiformis f. sp. tritici]